MGRMVQATRRLAAVKSRRAQEERRREALRQALPSAARRRLHAPARGAGDHGQGLLRRGARRTSGPRHGPGRIGAVKRPKSAFSDQNLSCKGLLYGRIGRLTAQNGAFRPGQVADMCESSCEVRRPLAALLLLVFSVVPPSASSAGPRRQNTHRNQHSTAAWKCPACVERQI